VITKSLTFLCDIGHTSANCFRNGESFKIDIDSFNPESFGDRVIYINVNQKFKNFPDHWIDLQPYVESDTEYKTLGIDRQVAIFGERNRVIVDFGSAVTIDVISDRHIGGYIMLGRDEVVRGFQRKTPHLKFKRKTILDLGEVPMVSEDALYYGFYHQTATFIESISKQHDLPITITGGYADEFLPLLKEAEIRKNLIFEKMELILQSTEIEL
jgi:type III pantothenate kinase